MPPERHCAIIVLLSRFDVVIAVVIRFERLVDFDSLESPCIGFGYPCSFMGGVLSGVLRYGNLRLSRFVLVDRYLK